MEGITDIFLSKHHILFFLGNPISCGVDEDLGTGKSTLKRQFTKDFSHDYGTSNTIQYDRAS